MDVFQVTDLTNVVLVVQKKRRKKKKKKRRRRKEEEEEEKNWKKERLIGKRQRFDDSQYKFGTFFPEG